jgi:hypothetical protein
MKPETRDTVTLALEYLLAANVVSRLIASDERVEVDRVYKYAILGATLEGGIEDLASADPRRLVKTELVVQRARLLAQSFSSEPPNSGNVGDQIFSLLNVVAEAMYSDPSAVDDTTKGLLHAVFAREAVRRIASV